MFSAINRKPGVCYAALTPNMKGFESALEAGVEEVAIFGAASDAFSLRNINCNVLDSMERFRPVCEAARTHGVRVRGYVSCVLGCPYEGHVAADAVAFVAQSVSGATGCGGLNCQAMLPGGVGPSVQLVELGCYEVSLGDTIGVGTPLSTQVHRLPLAAEARCGARIFLCCGLRDPFPPSLLPVFRPCLPR